MKELFGTEKFDGVPIDGYEGRFSGAFDIGNVEGRKLSWGDDVLIVVKARVKSATVRETVSGDVKRVNILRPDEVRFITENVDLQRKLVEALQLDSYTMPTLFDKPTDVDVKSSPEDLELLGNDNQQSALVDNGIENHPRSAGANIDQSALEDNARDMFSKTVDEDIDKSALDNKAINDIQSSRPPVDSNGDSSERWDPVWKKDDRVLARFLETGE